MPVLPRSTVTPERPGRAWPLTPARSATARCGHAVLSGRGNSAVGRSRRAMYRWYHPSSGVLRCRVHCRLAARRGPKRPSWRRRLTRSDRNRRAPAAARPRVPPPALPPHAGRRLLAQAVSPPPAARRLPAQGASPFPAAPVSPAAEPGRFRQGSAGPDRSPDRESAALEPPAATPVPAQRSPAPAYRPPTPAPAAADTPLRSAPGPAERRPMTRSGGGGCSYGVTLGLACRLP